MQRPRVVIVGGGISGLATAHALTTKHPKRFDVCVLEATGGLGGNVRTLHRDPYLIDEGPDSWVSSKPAMTALAREVGLGDRLIETIAENRKVYVRTEDGLVPLPEGLSLGIPTRLLPLVTTPLLSWRGKVRAAADLFLPKHFGRVPGEDEPLGAFIERRLGREVLENLAGPLLGGLFTGDVATLSLMGTFPQLAALEEQGSLIRGARALAPGASRTNGKPSVFTSLRGGVGELIDALAARLGGIITLNARVEQVVRTEHGLIVQRQAGAPVTADHVVLAGPAHVAASLVRPVCARLAAELAAIEYASAATVFLGYRRAAIVHPLDATGYLVPVKAPGRPLAATWASSKWAGRAPPDRALIRVFFGDADVERSDAELIAGATAEIAAVLGVRGAEAPDLVHVARFRRTSPQPRVGHPARIRRIRAAVAEQRGIHLLGSAYDGVGLGDCVRQANEAADRIAAPD